MQDIQRLPDDVISQVAAGEVVERPAAAIKELVENSLDAGAKKIVILTAKGGTRSFSVSDDGFGMNRENATLAVERHTTSKIRSAQDLVDVGTMGFRGEALSSIAAVSKFRLTTRRAEEVSGISVAVDGGGPAVVMDAGCPVGTLVCADSLFYNVPARLKFLRSVATEHAACLAVVQGMALANEGVAFSFRDDGREILSLPVASWGQRVVDVFGAKAAASLISAEPVCGEHLQVEGFFSSPKAEGSGRGIKFVFINGRHIVSPVVQKAVRDCYTSVLPRGVSADYIVRVTMDPGMFDCNVHPAKREVRLRYPLALENCVRDAVGDALNSAKKNLPAMIAPRVIPPSAAPAVLAPVVPPIPVTPEEAVIPPTPIAVAPMHPIPTPVPTLLPVEPRPVTPQYSVVCQMEHDYFTLLSDEGLVLLNLRAAYQRVIYERIKSGPATAQPFLVGVTVSLTPALYALALEHQGLLAGAGVEIDNFGPNTIRVETLPEYALDASPEKFFRELLSRLDDNADSNTDDAMAKSACATAAATLVASMDAAKSVLDSLMNCKMPYSSPTGKPTLVQIPYSEIDRRFHRKR